MLRFAALFMMPALASLGALADMPSGTTLMLVATSLLGTAAELWLNIGTGKRRKPSVIFFGIVCVLTFVSQVGIVVSSHITQAHQQPNVQQTQAQQAAEAPQAPRAELAKSAPQSAGQSVVETVPLLARGRGRADASAALVAPKPPESLVEWKPTKPVGSLRTVSIVLPCADERSNALNTVDRFCDRTPEDALAEIVVVDDGSHPPMTQLFAEDKRRLDQNPRCKLRILRHKETTGLMAAKQTGGKAAIGDIIAFFDCHCSPKAGWHVEILDQINAHPSRMVVPAITDLDLDTFDEAMETHIHSKCYLTFDGDFKWYDDKSDFIPTISGGLVAMGREWFNATGGFDEKMHGWGGENLDQSLRAWLCGGEITRASSSRVAHMWRRSRDPRTGARRPRDPRTGAHYHVKAKMTNNRGRVAAAWFDAFLPVYRGAIIDKKEVSNFDEVKRRLGCKPFAYFLYRFRKVYIDGGVIATTVFALQDTKSGKCLLGSDIITTVVCDEKNGRMLAFQKGNVDLETGKCCSGLRKYGTYKCADFMNNRGPNFYSCDISGQNTNQHYRLLDDGRILRPNDECVYLNEQSGVVESKPCSQLHNGQGIFKRLYEREPAAYRIYEAEVSRLGYEAKYPDLDDD